MEFASETSDHADPLESCPSLCEAALFPSQKANPSDPLTKLATYAPSVKRRVHDWMNAMIVKIWSPCVFGQCLLEKILSLDENG